MSYKIEYTEEARTDLRKLDGSQVKQVLEAIQRVSENPLPKSDGGYGNPLGNRQGNNLTGYCKIKLSKLGIRIVYRIVRTDGVMKIIVIAARADNEVYELAAKRTNPK